MLSAGVKRVGFVALVAAAGATACIFDEGGDYTGGGRRDVGAKIDKGEEEVDSGSGSSSSSSGSTADSGSNPFVDTGAGGG